MKQIYQMVRKITSSPYHDQMLRFATPLNDHFGINHFWYYKITYGGHYSCITTHHAFNEFCLDNCLVSHFPCLRHPDSIQEGIQLMKATGTEDYKKLLNDAWEKFQINFNFQIVKKVREGVEGFGFATRFNDPHADDRLLNELPLLRQFIKVFRERNSKIFRLLEDNQVDLPSEFGPVYYEGADNVLLPPKKDKLMRTIGLESILALTPRELDIMKYLSNGYPASYIARQLKIGTRTVENYMAVIKNKLLCNSKVELIQKAIEMASIDYFKSLKG